MKSKLSLFSLQCPCTFLKNSFSPYRICLSGYVAPQSCDSPKSLRSHLPLSNSNYLNVCDVPSQSYHRHVKCLTARQKSGHHRNHSLFYLSLSRACAAMSDCLSSSYAIRQIVGRKLEVIAYLSIVSIVAARC